MAQGGWSQRPIDIGLGGRGIRVPGVPQVSGALVGAALIGLVALIIVFTSFYQVQPDEVGVIQRFGKHVRTTDPGLHFKIPFGVERLTRVPVASGPCAPAAPRNTRPPARRPRASP
jgi:hypothetical protein